MVEAITLPRGIRNNNPGNLDKGPTYKGLTAVQPDPRFSTFISMPYGLRALGECLFAYHKDHGLNTVDQFIKRFAPPNENQTQAYVSAVAACCRVPPGAPYPLTPANMLLLLEGISRHENGPGDFIPQDDYAAAIHMLFKDPT